MQQKLKFRNREQLELSGVIHFPKTNKPLSFALFAHCFTCTKSINAAVAISETLAQQGIATLRFDFTGLGSSKGDFANSDFSSNINDLIDAADFLKSDFEAPQLLVGHSLGGTAILAAAEKIPSAKAVVSIGSPSQPEHILHLLSESLDELKQTGSANIELAGRPFEFKQAFVDDVRSHNINYRNLNKALLIMHSPHDDTVSVDEAGKIFTQAMHPKSFLSLDGADHLLSRKNDSQYVAKVLVNWAMRYIDCSESDDTISQGITANSKTDHGFLCQVQANGHQFLADEPTSYGGTNLGPSPYDLLGSALATCTAMTLNMYARHKKIDLQSVQVKVDHSRIHANDCNDCDKESGKVDFFNRSISLEGNLSVAQQARMLEIADKCPVHKTLENEIKIGTELNE